MQQRAQRGNGSGAIQNDGRGDRIRTCDPLLPKQMRYQTAPLPAFAIASASIEPWGSPSAAPKSAGSWARKDSNLQPSRYERPALPLRYRPSPVAVEIDMTRRRAKRDLVASVTRA